MKPIYITIPHPSVRTLSEAEYYVWWVLEDMDHSYVTNEQMTKLDVAISYVTKVYNGVIFAHRAGIAHEEIVDALAYDLPKVKEQDAVASRIWEEYDALTDDLPF